MNRYFPVIGSCTTCPPVGTRCKSGSACVLRGQVLSRFRPLARLMGMNKKIWVAAIVLAHLIVTIVHGAAHTKAQVPLSPAASAFVFSVILAGPLVGVGLMLLAGRMRALWVGATL